MLHDLQILGFGAVTVDDIVYVDRPLSAGKGRVTARITDHGGNVATALVAVATLGGRAGFIGWLNDRAPDDLSGRELERAGVDTSLAPRRSDAKAIRSLVMVDPNGDRFIAFDDDVPHGTSDAMPDEVLAQSKVLLIDGYATHSAGVVARARALGLAVVADLEWTIGPASDALMDLADHLVLPLGFARAQVGEAEPATILDKLWSEDRAAVVLTDGERGAHLRQRGDPVRWHIPAYEVTAVDTTGAGDCFHGAYALALSEGKSPLGCALFAAAAAAISVTGLGGRLALPRHDACLRLMSDERAPVPRPIPQPAVHA